MTTLPLRITGGVDTHLDVHVAAALDDTGGAPRRRVVRHDHRPATAAFFDWLRGFGEVELVGVEGTGSYGAGLTRHLHAEAVRVVEVDRPNRQRRRRRASPIPKTPSPRPVPRSPVTRRGEAKTRDGNVEAMRVLRVARCSARKARTQALNQMRSLISTGPDDDPCRAARPQRVPTPRALPRPFGPAAGGDPRSRRPSCRCGCSPAARWRSRPRSPSSTPSSTPLVADTAPELVARLGIGTDMRIGVARRRRRQPRTAPQRSDLRPPLRRRHRSTPAAARTNVTVSTAAVTAKPTPRCGRS